MTKKYERKDWHQSPDKRKRLGVKGEDIACSYLERQGFEVLERNVRFSFGELDIVARDNKHLIFIEVKTRSSDKFGRPSLALTSKKQRTIRNLAQCYIRTHKKYSSLSPRIDVIELLFQSDGEMLINHIFGAF